MGPVKKRRHAESMPAYRGMEKLLFRLVLPYLFPGFYGHDHRLAFRTYLSLAGVCARLRYWNFLRRWVAFTCPPKLRDRLRSHSFWTPLKPDEIDAEQKRMRQALEDRDELMDVGNPIFRSCYLKNAFCAASGDQRFGNYEKDVGGNPFYDVIECLCTSTDNRGLWRDRTILCFRAASFSELCLFVYSMCFADEGDTAHDDRSPVTAYLLHCSWRVPDGHNAFFLCQKSQIMSVVNRRILGWLRRVGSYAPHEIGFHQGRLVTNSYGLFFELSNTNGKRGGKTPFGRLEQFVHEWFPMELFGANPVRPAYEIPMIFE